MLPLYSQKKAAIDLSDLVLGNQPRPTKNLSLSSPLFTSSRYLLKNLLCNDSQNVPKFPTFSHVKKSLSFDFFKYLDENLEFLFWPFKALLPQMVTHDISLQ